MKKFLIITTLIFTIGGTCTDNLYGSHDESGGYAGAFLQGGIGARAISMGSSFTAVADNGTALFWNPAGLPQINRFELSLMHSVLYEDRSKNYASLNMPLGRLAVSAGWLGFNVTQIQERNNQGQLLGHFDDSENVFLVGGGLSLISNRMMHFNVGATGKYFYHSLYEYSATGSGADAGALLQFQLPVFLKKVSIGAVVQNIGASMKWDTDSGYEAVIPMTYRAGALLDIALLPVKVTADVEKHEKQDMRLHFGAEYDLLNTVFLRAGMNDNSLTAGAGIRLSLVTTQISVNYAYATDEISEQPLHYFTLGLGL